MSEVDIGGTAVEYLPTSIPLHFVAVGQMAAEGQADKMASDMEVHMKRRGGSEFFHEKKTGTRWHSLTLTKRLWSPDSGYEHSKGTAFQQWWQQVTSTGADFYEHRKQAFVRCWRKRRANTGSYVKK